MPNATQCLPNSLEFSIFRQATASIGLLQKSNLLDNFAGSSLFIDGFFLT